MTFPDPARLERVLTDPEALGGEDLAHVQTAGLSGFVGRRLPAGHPLQGQLLSHAASLAARHREVSGALHALLREWSHQGIDALLLGGFALNEFEYAAPDERVYHEVTLLLPAHTVERAAGIAGANGWWSDGLHREPDLWTHEILHLFHQEVGVMVNVCRTVFSPAGRPEMHGPPVTAELWAHARVLDWQGVTVSLPDPADLAVLVALRRSWGGEAGQVQPVDYTDLLVLTGRYALTPAALNERAALWGATHTWRVFLNRCDPYREALALTAGRPDPLLRHAAWRDGVRVGEWGQGWRVLRQTAPYGLATLGHVLVAWWAVRRGGDPRRHLARWTRDIPVRPLPYGTVLAVIRAVQVWTELLFPRQSRRGVCVPRSYATYRALRRLGHPVVFVTGVVKSGGVLRSHAWVEDVHGEWKAYEIGNRRKFQVVFQFPELPESAETL